MHGGTDHRRGIGPGATTGRADRRRLGALAMALAAAPGAAPALTPETFDCAEANDLRYSGIRDYGSVRTAWVEGGGKTPHVAVISCTSHRVLEVVMLPDQGAPPVQEMLLSPTRYTLDSFAAELSAQGFEVTKTESTRRPASARPDRRRSRKAMIEKVLWALVVIGLVIMAGGLIVQARAKRKTKALEKKPD
jgi:hypothetical protein